ncbi:MAG: tRNA 2-thiouridine(34) synthase MnmA [Clostridiales Family XIII bacterium]|jgi:tRNA-specific 2-thiouridylase|nr:tRNA 2-thiouridine(34) synthase MnmA [Clostridiales Family XIII bacterium]
MKPAATRALIAMSGGVDSSVAALLCRDAGLDCVGVTMKLFDNDDIYIASDSDGSWETGRPYMVDPKDSRTCCSLSDADDAARVCGMLGIPFYVFDFSEDFRRDVMKRFAGEYAAGRTPNPCIDCNRYVKYGRLYRRMRGLGFDFLVTGHYARVERDGVDGRWLLKRAKDEAKDQSYVLYNLTQEQLAHTRFPLGGMNKDEVRDIAAANGFANARKRDSQDICFVPDGRYADFIESFTGRTWPSGEFVDTDGHVLGRHKGIIRYTIGQRKGLGSTFGRPMYVVDIRPDANEVVLGVDARLPAREVKARDINLIAVPRIDGSMRVTAKIRYNHKDSPAVAEQTGDDEIALSFDEPQRAVTHGQAAVLYDGDNVIGGGTIV